MDYLSKKLKLANNTKKSNYSLKNWVISFLKVVVKNGKYLKYINFLYYIFKRLVTYCTNLVYFFKIIHKHLVLPVYFKTRVVAGKKHLIPFRLINEKKYCFMWRLIIESSFFRTEPSFVDKIYFELIDIFKNKGLTLKRRLQICKDIKNNTPNLRFLKW